MVTGNSRRLAEYLKRDLPANLQLTGFLSDAGYAGLITSADAVMTLTTRDHTMLRGAYEAIYQGTPVIVSDWPLLRRAFDRGAIHVDNSVPAIVDAVQRMRERHVEFRHGAQELQRYKSERWSATLVELRRAIGDAASAPASGTASPWHAASTRRER
jgi:glycosyltransferase involved in cell wall biosynthesis